MLLPAAVPRPFVVALVRGAQARVRSTGDGFAVEIRSDDEATAREILARARRLRAEAMARGAEAR